MSCPYAGVCVCVCACGLCYRVRQAVVKHVPPPRPPSGGPLRALIYDSVYDEFRVGLAGTFFVVFISATSIGCEIGQFLALSTDHTKDVNDNEKKLTRTSTRLIDSQLQKT